MERWPDLDLGSSEDRLQVEQKQRNLQGGPCGGRERGLGPGWSGQWRPEQLEPQD